MTREQALQLAQEFHQRLIPICGDRLQGVYLYGSYARDEADEDSDVDVALVLTGALNAWEEGQRISEVVGELSLRETCVIVPFLLSEEEYRTAPYAIHRSIVREGVAA